MPNQKYKFSELTGNQLNISLLKRSINNETFRQFTVFAGVFGTGKSTCSRIAAMALTCENQYNGEPCCSCDICRENMKAFDMGVDSSYVRTVNAGLMTSREDIKAMVHDIFDLQGSVHSKVFRIEEAHAFSRIPNTETMLLSEIDSMPANVYVMFSTTKLYELSDELKSRAEIYTFGRLSDLESMRLLETASEQRSYEIPEEVLSLIVKYGKGIPRNLLKSLDFLIDENASISELRAHLQIIDDSQLVHLFEDCMSTQIQQFALDIDKMKEAVEAQEIYASIKSFLVSVAFLIEGDVQGTFTKDDADSLRRIFTRDRLYKIVNLVNDAPRRVSATDLDMILLQMRMIIQNRGAGAVITQSGKVGAAEKAQAEETKSVTSRARVMPSVKKITLDEIKNMQG